MQDGPMPEARGALGAEAVCWVCLESAGRATRSRAADLQRGCSCRGASSWLHFPCLLAMSDQQEALGKDGARCPTCKQQFTGSLELELGRAKFARVAVSGLPSLPCRRSCSPQSACALSPGRGRREN